MERTGFGGPFLGRAGFGACPPGGGRGGALPGVGGGRETCGEGFFSAKNVLFVYEFSLAFSDGHFGADGCACDFVNPTSGTVRFFSSDLSRS